MSKTEENKMNKAILYKREIREYLYKTTKSEEIKSVCIINMKTGEMYPTNEMSAFSDFERLTKKYGDCCSLFFPAGNTGR